MTSEKKPGEDYTYGERLTAGPILYDRVLYAPYDMYGGEVNQIEKVIEMFKNNGHGTNQACMEIGMPGDILLGDPPCLRLIDCRVRDNKLSFIVYFRSWDLWNGFSANLGGLQMLKEYMAAEIGIEDGEIIASSKGLHLYDYAWDLASLRTYRECIV
jgi:thymidylate synthase